MDKEKEIQEMANIFCTVDDELYVACAECGYYDEENDTIKSCPNYSKGKALKELLNNAGYRKADEVRRETAKEIAQEINSTIDCVSAPEIPLLLDILEMLKKEYGVEVEE